GAGIVPTVENFGRSGARPTNQRLLDWLAVNFKSTGVVPGTSGNPPGAFPLAWRLKALHRLIVTSAAYRQASAWRADGGKVDPGDRLLWRQRPRRLEAEAVRDAMLAAAGTLDARMFGEPDGTETRATGE